MTVFEGSWRFCLADHKKFGEAGKLEVVARNADAAKVSIQEQVATRLRVRRHKENISVYDIMQKRD